MLLYDAAVMGVLAVLTVALFGVMGLLHASVIVVSLSLPLSVFFFDDDNCLLCIIRHIWMIYLRIQNLDNQILKNDEQKQNSTTHLMAF